jgi:hypothetical protein
VSAAIGAAGSAAGTPASIAWRGRLDWADTVVHGPEQIAPEGTLSACVGDPETLRTVPMPAVLCQLLRSAGRQRT